MTEQQEAPEARAVAALRAGVAIDGCVEFRWQPMLHGHWACVESIDGGWRAAACFDLYPICVGTPGPFQYRGTFSSATEAIDALAAKLGVG